MGAASSAAQSATFLWLSQVKEEVSTLTLKQLILTQLNWTLILTRVNWTQLLMFNHQPLMNAAADSDKKNLRRILSSVVTFGPHRLDWFWTGSVLKLHVSQRLLSFCLDFKF